jgi:hypothetical protein
MKDYLRDCYSDSVESSPLKKKGGRLFYILSIGSALHCHTCSTIDLDSDNRSKPVAFTTKREKANRKTRSFLRINFCLLKKL